ncbi:MAG: alkaline phytoceramidase, partial [Betaproteobacteria bacterium]|nr:alkaline phytoceramidase [Betaproteobacteria bacterium]
MSPGAWLLLAAAGLTVLAFLLPLIAQPPAYHDFADRRACFGLPNCLDSASN